MHGSGRIDAFRAAAVAQDSNVSNLTSRYHGYMQLCVELKKYNVILKSQRHL